MAAMYSKQTATTYGKKMENTKGWKLKSFVLFAQQAWTKICRMTELENLICNMCIKSCWRLKNCNLFRKLWKIAKCRLTSCEYFQRTVCLKSSLFPWLNGNFIFYGIPEAVQFPHSACALPKSFNVSCWKGHFLMILCI